MEKSFPRLLVLPMLIAEYIQAQGGNCLPQSLHTYISDHLDGDTKITPARWKPLRITGTNAQ